MFYSHEMLTSQEHGVATIWLVATLGPKTTSKKVNRKAILGVDVSRACDTIMNPEAPMALRLQGNLLYGVSRVYSRQCVYALIDVQAMLDRMKTALKVVHGLGLDPEAGKANPEELVVPYDPAFIPDLNLPGLNLNLANPLARAESQLNIHASLLSSNTSGSNPSPMRIDVLPQLDISSPSLAVCQIGGSALPSDRASSAHDHIHPFGPSTFADEAGVLLQPDFEFDEEGNLVDLSVGERSLSREHDNHLVGPSEHIAGTGVNVTIAAETLSQGQPHDELMDLDQNKICSMEDDSNDHLRRGRKSPTWGRLPDPEYLEGAQARNAKLSRKRRMPKTVEADEHPQIDGTELLRWGNEYLHNMKIASKQKRYTKDLTQAKKNASFWVFNQGIGSVGVGIGVSRASLPLQSFCGEQLLEALSGESLSEYTGRKRSFSLNDDHSSDDKRRVRARFSQDEIAADLPRGDGHGFGNPGALMQEGIEIGRHAPPSLPDDASSQMPWNITASIQGSHRGSLSSLSHPFDSVDIRQLGGPRRLGGRFPSSSPLAGRSHMMDLARYDRLSSLSLTGNELDSLDILEEFDMDTYLVDDHAGTFDGQEHSPASGVQGAAETQETVSSLSQADRNFFEFMKSKIYSLRSEATAENAADTQSKKEITFSMLLPPETTTATVATQGLMHVLSLATRDVLTIRQDNEYTLSDLDASAVYGEVYLKPKDPYC